jgi:DNA-binding PadR family transcriptional regulator
MTSSACRCQGANLDRFVHCSVLTALAAGPAHGYLLLDRLGELPSFTGCRPDPTGVYRILREMEELGLVLGAWEHPASGPAKRRYEITEDGIGCLAQWADALDRHQQVVAQLAKLARKAVKP